MRRSMTAEGHQVLRLSSPRATGMCSRHRTGALAIHVCADMETTGLHRCWPPLTAVRDTVHRAQRICAHAGVAEQRTLDGDHATAEALRDALRHAAAALSADGVLVVTFSGHSERGDGPIETARWCLVGGPVTLSQIADQLAQLPPTARLVIIADTCYAAAIAHCLRGAQPAIVIASCGDDQTMIERARSEFVVRLEDFLCSRRRPGSIDALRAVLEADTPDCERPVVWSNAPDRWPDQVIAVPRNHTPGSGLLALDHATVGQAPPRRVADQAHHLGNGARSPRQIDELKVAGLAADDDVVVVDEHDTRQRLGGRALHEEALLRAVPQADGR
jgi:hypothetical protein